MPPLNTHLIIGEQVFPHLAAFDERVYGDFLLGCLVTDVNAFSDVDRRVTHFVGRVHEDGVAAYTQSCTNFLQQLESLLKSPWDTLSLAEQAFVSGYLCHLAADEPWKALGADIMRVLHLDSMKQMPVPGSVMLTAFSVMSHAAYVDFDAVQVALADVTMPDVFTHVAYADFVRMWDVFYPTLPYARTMDAFFMMLKRHGTSEAELHSIREEHKFYWDKAMAFIQALGGPQPYLDKAVAHALEVLPYLSLRVEP